MPPDRSDSLTPRTLQQQPVRESDPQQQRAGGTEFQPRSAEGGDPPLGEGSYDATRDYQENIKAYMERADLESDAERAKPRSEQEAREMDQAERAGRAHSKGER